MENVLYVGNLPFDASVPELRARFAECGEVTEVEIVADRERGQSRSFAVVTMKLQTGANHAIQRLNGVFFSGRSLVVSRMAGRVLSAKPVHPAPQGVKTEPVRPVPSGIPARQPVAAPVQERAPFQHDDDGSERRRKRRGEPVAKAPVRMLQQFRERTHMTYELECSGTPLVVRIFFPGDGPAAEWRVEARTTTGSDVASATAPSRAQALESIARAWHDQDGARAPTKVDWDGVTRVMASVRAI